MHRKWELLKFLSQIRDASRGDFHKRPSQDAFDVLAIMRGGLKADLEREPTDNEVRDRVDLGLKTLIAEVTHSGA